MILHTVRNDLTD